MEVRAIAKSVRISPRKMRLVSDMIRNLPVEEAYKILAVTDKRAARPVSKTLKSAVANAVVNAKLDSRNLFVSNIQVNESQPLKRFRPSTRGRIHPYKKKGSHLTIVLQEKIVATPVKPAIAASTTETAPAAAVSQKADEAAAAAIYGGTEDNKEKKGGVRGLAARLTGRKTKTSEPKKK